MEKLEVVRTNPAIETDESLTEPPVFAVGVSFDTDTSFWKSQRRPSSSSSHHPYITTNNDQWVEGVVCSKDADHVLSSMQHIDRKVHNRGGMIRWRERQHEDHGNLVRQVEQHRDDDHNMRRHAGNSFSATRMGMDESINSRNWNNDYCDDVLSDEDRDCVDPPGFHLDNDIFRDSTVNRDLSDDMDLSTTDQFHSIMRHPSPWEDETVSVADGFNRRSFAGRSAQSCGSASQNLDKVQCIQHHRQFSQRMRSGPSSQGLRSSVLEQRRLNRCGTVDSTFILDDLQDMKTQIESVLEEQHESGSALERIPIPKVVGIDAFQSDSSHTSLSGAFYPGRSLWKLLLEQRWEWAEERLQLHPDEAKQPVNLQRILLEEQTGCDDDECGEELDDVVFPLHLACVVRPLPPVSLLQKLVDAYPNACFHAQPSSGQLPVHMASDLRSSREKTVPRPTKWLEQSEFSEQKSNDISRYAHNPEDFARQGDIVCLLLAKYPKSIVVREKVHQMIPLHIAASTAIAENGIVSPSASRVLEFLVAASPPGEDLVNTCQDANGLTPQDWAWKNVCYFCPRCGMENVTTSDGGYDCVGGKDADNEKRIMNRGGDDCYYGENLLSLDAGMPCGCQEVLSVTGKCLHPLLRKEIRSQLLETGTTETAQSKETRIRYEYCEDAVPLPVNSTTSEQQQQQQQQGQQQGQRQRQRQKQQPQIRTDNSDTPYSLRYETVDVLHSMEDDLRYSEDGGSSNDFREGHESQHERYLLHSFHDSALGDTAMGQGEDKRQEERQETKGTDILSPRIIDSIHYHGIADYSARAASRSKQGECKTAILHMKIRLSELVHPSKQNYFNGSTIRRLSSCHGSGNDRSQSSSLRRSKNHKVPIPYFEMFASHRRGMSNSHYKSYPILSGSTEGTWEDAFLDLGLTHEQLRHGTSGAGNVQVGIRVMHCPKKGSHTQRIGICVVNLESLERQRNERLRSVFGRFDDIRNSDGVVVDDAQSLKEPEKLPILNGFKVTGRLQVLSFSIE